MFAVPLDTSSSSSGFLWLGSSAFKRRLLSCCSTRLSPITSWQTTSCIVQADSMLPLGLVAKKYPAPSSVWGNSTLPIPIVRSLTIMGFLFVVGGIVRLVRLKFIVLAVHGMDLLFYVVRRGKAVHWRIRWGKRNNPKTSCKENMGPLNFHRHNTITEWKRFRHFYVANRMYYST